ncbi:MAG: hypothetical protein AAFY41_00535 [Bacteroidota bacterium]
MKNSIKLILSISMLASTFILTAQQIPDFDAEKAAGIVTYDTEKVIKKLKVEDLKAKQSIAKSIEQYNMKMYELSDTHAATFQELNAYFERQVQVAIRNRDRSQMDGFKTKVKETIPPIKKEVIVHENALNESMQSLLDDKQFNKWMKYQKSQKPTPSAMMGG